MFPDIERKIYVIEFRSRKYSMLADISYIYHLCYGKYWYWLAASSMLLIRISGIQLLIFPCLCIFSVITDYKPIIYNTWMKLSAVYWTCSTNTLSLYIGFEIVAILSY